MISQFKKDPNTTTDEILAKAAAHNDLFSTISGSIVSIAGAILPMIIMFSNAPENVKMAALAGGVVTGGAEAVIARQQPQCLQQIASERIKQQSQSSDEGQY